ncbi:MAG: OB-fold domain-containing protein [Betaproteobacteria bacterium]|nr:OB-fold domain-containing protein [Betaproteobacteria bacterium]MBI2293521.1 OB-fold domain-containing protein [Betaproteobacteria bacterium]MBI3056504.1 OB-fold domain-containing protein [Betaproteobacteria bacterium]
MTETSDFPLPEVTPLTAPYWQALAAGRLVFQRCRKCGHAWLPARSECNACLGDDVGWENASGRGRIVSWVIYHYAFNKAFRDRLPYNVAIVALEEGPRLITNIVNPEAGLAADRPVELAIGQEHGVALARFCVV